MGMFDDFYSFSNIKSGTVVDISMKKERKNGKKDDKSKRSQERNKAKKSSKIKK